ncbi:hypothetical protein D3C78_1597140 [compost metagenome]
MLLAQMDDGHGIFRLITGNDDRFGLCRTGCPQQFQLRGIPVINLVTVAAQYANRANIPLKHGDTHLVSHQ